MIWTALPCPRVLVSVGCGTKNKRKGSPLQGLPFSTALLCVNPDVIDVGDHFDHSRPAMMQVTSSMNPKKISSMTRPLY